MMKLNFFLEHMLPMDEALFDELGAKKEQEAVFYTLDFGLKHR